VPCRAPRHDSTKGAAAARAGAAADDQRWRKAESEEVVGEGRRQGPSSRTEARSEHAGGEVRGSKLADGRKGAALRIRPEGGAALRRPAARGERRGGGGRTGERCGGGWG